MILMDHLFYGLSGFGVSTKVLFYSRKYSSETTSVEPCSPQCFVIYSGEAHFKEKTDADTVNADKTHDRLRTNLLTIFTQLHLKGRPGILSLIPSFARMRFSTLCSRTPHDQAERSSDEFLQQHTRGPSREDINPEWTRRFSTVWPLAAHFRFSHLRAPFPNASSDSAAVSRVCISFGSSTRLSRRGSLQTPPSTRQLAHPAEFS